MQKFSALILAAAVSSAGPAHAVWSAESDPHLPVNRVTATTFEVIEKRGAGAQDIWCAAARFAEDVLGKQRGRLYVAKARGPAQTAPGAKGVLFTIDTPANASKSYSVSVNVEGQGLLLAHARQFCWNYVLELED
ncbi:hypothetical protein E4Z66_11385 [Aliishimia ponticola]|uniref:DUF4019 domain-containing protein n=1 Tax=Aliishimia ponticola TaxID=2499833 RepID=A0A4S4N8Y4_9RHOB|nr:hypothetical protein [Aliishimia ponticola]THH35686.1 hypothetical protein E4Z66_11385 [Aliishimia ponticola]